MVYLDYAANTPVDERVLKVYNSATKEFIANPNSKHELGVLAKKKIDAVSKKIANYFNIDTEGVIYTSGSTESNNLVIKGIAEQRKSYGNKIIISAIEHSSIVAPCNYLQEHGFDIVVIPLTKEGTINMDILKQEIDNKTILVSICTVDSELGTIQPINDISKLVRKYPNCVFHTDATQAIGKIKLDYKGVDFITFSPHKFYGINGIGVLLNMNNKQLIPLVHGGRSTTIYRSGTPVTANILALSKALSLAIDNLNTRYTYIKKLNVYLKDNLKSISDIHINSPENGVPNIINFSVSKNRGSKVIKNLEKDKIYVSAASACSLNNAPSKSVLAITNDMELAKNSVRISLSHLTTKKDIDLLLKSLRKYLKS